MPFLTLEDPNAKVRGSRDPLGTVPIWSAFARHVVTNITSVSSSVRGFTTLLLGRYFAARLIEDGTLPAEEALNVVLRTEQAAAYARHVAHSVEDDIRGIERVKRFLAEGRGKVTIQADRRGLILSDQKVYGLWGLYSVAARRSGLLTDGTFGVTPIARTFIEQHYTKHLNGAEKPFLRLVAGGGTLTTHADDPVFAALARILPPAFTAPEIEFYGRQLRDAHTDQATEGPTRQQRFSRLLELHTNLETPINREEVRTLATAAASTDETLATSLDRIIHLESILAPAAAVFDFVLTRTNQPPAEVGAAIRTRWGHRVPNLDPHAFEDLIPEITGVTTPAIAAAIRRCHRALHTGDYESAVRAAIDWNTKVQEGRKGAPWVVLTDTGTLDVRYRVIEHLMPTAEELPTLWRNTYFIDALKHIIRQLRGPAS